MFIIRTGLPILVELVDLVNSYNFTISNGPTQMVNLPTRITDCDSHSPAPLDLFISSDTSICSAIWLSLQWEILVMLLSQSPVTFQLILNRMPHFIA